MGAGGERDELATWRGGIGKKVQGGAQGQRRFDS